MTNKDESRKVVSWERDALPTGFERTLSPSDPSLRSEARVSNHVIRDNRRGVVLSGNAALLVTDSEPPPPSDARVSGIRTGIPVANITRDEVAAPAQGDSFPPLEVTPDFASEYVPPRPVPEGSQHKTFELKAVRLSPEIHPRTAPTVLNARTRQRRFDKQQKDAREIAAFMQQSERRRRGPLVVVACLSVMTLGFVLGTRLVNSSSVKAVPELPSASEVPGEQVSTKQAPGFAREPERPGLAREVSGPDHGIRSVGPTPRPSLRARDEPTATRAVPPRSEPSGDPSSGSEPNTSSADQQAGSQSAPRVDTVREVWLR